MRKHRIRATTLAATALAAALSLTACNDSNASSATGTGAPSGTEAKEAGSKDTGVIRGTGANGAASAATAKTGDGTGNPSALSTGGGGSSDRSQSCRTNDLTWSARSGTQADGSILVAVKAKPGVTCVLPGGLPVVAFGSGHTQAGNAEQVTGGPFALGGSTVAYAGVKPKTTKGDYGKELTSIIVSASGDDPNPVSLNTGTITVDKPIVTNWHNSAKAAVIQPSAANVVSALKFTSGERQAALAYWTPSRIKAVGKSVDLGPTGPKAEPWRGSALNSVGRLFFVNSRGSDTWCTATAVKSANRSVAMTAGHCVRRGASPANTNSTMVFVPGYSKGKMPYGAFAVRTALSPRSWEKESTNDLAALVVDTGKGGKLTDVVGGQAIAFNRAVGGTISSFGYPATHPQLGEELLRCVGTPQKEKAGMQFIPCDMTGGSSGGPWLADFNATTGKGVLVSVNSELDSLTPTRMYGPVLGATAKSVYDQAQRG
jgi:hypothetical protein